MKRTLSVWAAGTILAVSLIGCEGAREENENPDETTPPVAVQPTATPTAVTSPGTASPGAATSTDTANWKTYRNAAVGYSIKYPASWRVDEQNESAASKVVTVRSGKVRTFGQVVITMEGMPWEDLRAGYVNDENAEEAQTSFAGKTAYRFTFPETTSEHTTAASKIFIPLDNKLVSVIVGGFESDITNKVAASITF